MTFGDRLRQLRGELGWSQSRLANEIDMYQNAIYLWEKGKAYPNSISFAKLCSVMEISTEEFLKGVDDYGKKRRPQIMTFSDRLKELRESKNMNVNQFAQELNTSKSLIYQYELGTEKPSLNRLGDICRILDVTPAEFMEGVEL